MNINLSSSTETKEYSGTDRIENIDKFLRRCRLSKHLKKKTDEDEKRNTFLNNDDCIPKIERISHKEADKEITNHE